MFHNKKMALTLLIVMVFAALPVVPSAAQDDVTVEFWVFSDFAAGDTGELLEQFANEFEAANPGITIEIIGKNPGDIVTGLVIGAGSGELPDVVSTQFGEGHNLLPADVLLDVAPYWAEMPAEWQAQFSPAAVEILTQGDAMWGIPLTGFATLLFRNLNVLESAGIDPAEPIRDWNHWLEQMQMIADSGAFASGKILGSSALGIKSYYGGIPGTSVRLSDDGSETLVDAEAYAQMLEFLLAAEEYNAEVPFHDQASTDLFITNEMAFIAYGPWRDGAFAAAAAEGDLRYDVVLIPGQVEGEYSGARGGEFLAVIDGPNAEAAWKWAAFLSDAPQMTRFAALTGRFVLNDVALQDPSVASNTLVQITAEAFPHSIDEAAFFQQVPDDYYSTFVDYTVLADQGVLSAEEAGAQVVELLNEQIAEMD
jgi:multiple sugar transport system substrate-binding protein